MIHPNPSNILTNYASAALTKQPSLELVKPSYGFIDTGRIIDRFSVQGWELTDAKQARVKNENRLGFQKHLLRFRNPLFPKIDGLTDDNHSIPELIIENSHDGTSALRVFFGVFRIVCLNGMIAGSSFRSMRIIHSQNMIKNIDSAIDEMTENVPELIARVSRFQSIELTDEKRLELAQKAADLRLAYTPGVESVRLPSVLRPKRLADTKRDAFSVFNVVQENVIRGGIEFIQKQPDESLSFKKTRAISSVTQSVKLNRELWNVLETVAA